MSVTTMTPSNKDWPSFHVDLAKSLGSPASNICSHDHQHTEAVLAKYNCDSPSSISYFKSHGGYCDCEVLFNVGDA
jgi:hypothetical protein